MKKQDPARQLTRRTLFTYSLGGIGRDMAYSLYSTYLLSFILYTKNLSDGQFAAISVIMIICRIWDAVNDPMMGGIIENTHTKMGKFKPWILIGVLSNSVILVTLFSARLQGWGFVVFFVFMYLLWDITFTMNDIGYWSMLPSLTTDTKDRNLLTSLANLFAGLGSILSLAFIPLLTVGSMAIGGSTVTAYSAVAVIISACFIGCQVMTVVGVQERGDTHANEESVGFGKMVKIITGNDQLLWIALVMLLYNLGSAIITGLGTNYIYFQYGYNGSYVTLFVVVFGAASGIIMALFPFLSSHLSRKALMRGSIAMILVGYFSIFAFSYISLNFYLLCAFGLVIGIGQAVFYMVITINITNTVEYNEWKTGSRNEGIIFSIRPFMAKMGSALQQLVIMIVYLALGVTQVTNSISDAENAVSRGLMSEQAKLTEIAGILESVPSGTTTAMRVCMVFIPMALLTLAYITMRKKCTIDEKRYDEMLEDIKNRNAGGGSTAGE